MLRIGSLCCSPGRAQPELATLRQPAASSRPCCAARRYAQGGEYSPIQTKEAAAPWLLSVLDPVDVSIGVGRRKPAPRPGVVSFASFRLDKQTKGSRAAARNKSDARLVSAERLLGMNRRDLNQRLSWISIWGFALMRERLIFACPNQSIQSKRHPVLRRCCASIPCAARQEGNSRKLAALRATQTSGCFSPFLPTVLGAGPRG